MSWFRGGAPRPAGPNWWTRWRPYAEFYGRDVYQLVPAGEILDLAWMGVDVDLNTLADEQLPAPRTASGEMYEWAERAWGDLRAAGYHGVIVKQWHADFDDKAYTSLYYWGPLEVKT